MSIKMICALAAFAALGASAGAHAAANPQPSSDDVVRVTVNYGDLDLSGQAGANTMLQRIHRAARDVCGDRPGGTQLGDMHRYQACMTSAVDRAVASLGSPTVSALNDRGASHGVVLADRER